MRGRLILYSILACATIALSVNVSAQRRNVSSNKPLEKESPISPDVNPRALWDGRKSVDFHALDFPKMVTAQNADFLVDYEYVLGITENGESRAYPTRYISWHHIINDKIGKKEQGGSEYIAITYCIVCNSGIGFSTPVVDKKPLKFDFYGLYNGVMTMYDTNTGSVWLQVAGRSVKGALLDTNLKRLPLLDTTWGQWKRLHPDTLVMAPDSRSVASYESKGSVMARGYSSFPAPYFSPTVTRRDTRLPMFEPVLAVSVPVSQDYAALARNSDTPATRRILHRAYPQKAFQGRTGVINDVLGDTPVAVMYDATTQTLCAVSRNVGGGRTLTIEARKSPQGRRGFYDKETNSRWSIEGKAEEGSLKGMELQRIDSHNSQWYGWVSYFPETTIYTRPITPKPSEKR